MTTLKKIVRRVSNSKLSSSHGKDKHRRIVISLIPGNGDSVPDLIMLRPERTKRARMVAVEDLYSYMIRCEANQQCMAKLREKKAKKEQQRKERAWARELRRKV